MEGPCWPDLRLKKRDPDWLWNSESVIKRPLIAAGSAQLRSEQPRADPSRRRRCRCFRQKGCDRERSIVLGQTMARMMAALLPAAPHLGPRRSLCGWGKSIFSASKRAPRLWAPSSRSCDATPPSPQRSLKTAGKNCRMASPQISSFPHRLVMETQMFIRAAISFSGSSMRPSLSPHNALRSTMHFA